MTRKLTMLITGVVATIVVAVAVGLSAGTPNDKKAEESKPGGQGATRRPPDPVIAQATAYALAVRNWSAATYPASWARQVSLAGGRYRRALRAAKPTAGELTQLRRDGARSTATVAQTQRDPTITPPAGRVVVTLEEETIANGQTIRGRTVNQVALREIEGRWRVTDWTAIPAATG